MGRRVKVGGDLYHGQVPAGAVYVGRQAPGLLRSPWANPYPVKQFGPIEALNLYWAHLEAHPDLVADARRDIGDRDVACWCPLPAPDQPDPCHGAILLEAIADNGGVT